MKTRAGLLTLDQAAAALKVSRRELDRGIVDGSFPLLRVRDGSRWRVTPSALDAAIRGAGRQWNEGSFENRGRVLRLGESQGLDRARVDIRQGDGRQAQGDHGTGRGGR